ncbi:MAG: DNA polymerase Y family protein [Alphaproteobacteria bacterium]|nr:DNA polymerase Y family protein [Alphaproteobacteria bacterium]
MTIGSRRLVAAVNEAAAAAGIAPGLPLADAQAFLPGLAVCESDPAGDAAALRRLAEWCGRWSPWTAPDGADGILLDITGCAHLWGGEEELMADILARIAGQGFASKAAIAGTSGAAWAVARFGEGGSRIVPPGAEHAVLAALPTAALRLASETVAALERLGLKRIGDLGAMPRAALARRFGDGVARRLDQALGAAGEPVSPLRPAPARRQRLAFAEPIATPEDLARACRHLVAALCRGLAAEGVGARRLDLACYRVDGRVERAGIGTARPSRDPRHLARLLEEKLAALDPGLGIEDMVLAAPIAEPLGAVQLPSFLSGRGSEVGDDTALAALLDRLGNRLGPANLCRLVPRESHWPERAVALSPALAAREGAALSWPAERRRPIRLLAPPEPIEATAPVPDDPPVMFRWRRRLHRVRRADGPERIAGEWWRAMLADADLDDIRDYYRVEDAEGRRFWLFRAGLYRPARPARWFLHGLFA